MVGAPDPLTTVLDSVIIICMAVDPMLLLSDVAAMRRLCRSLWASRREVHPRVYGGLGFLLVALTRLHVDIVESHRSQTVARLSGRGPRGGRWVLRDAVSVIIHRARRRAVPPDLRVLARRLGVEVPA